MVTVKVDGSAEVPVMSTEVGDRVQVAGLVAALVVMVQVRATVPVKPLDGVTLIVDVLPVVAPPATEIAPLLDRANPGAAAVQPFTTLATLSEPRPVARS